MLARPEVIAREEEQVIAREVAVAGAGIRRWRGGATRCGLIWLSKFCNAVRYLNGRRGNAIGLGIDLRWRLRVRDKLVAGHGLRNLGGAGSAMAGGYCVWIEKAISGFAIQGLAAWV